MQDTTAQIKKNKQNRVSTKLKTKAKKKVKKEEKRKDGKILVGNKLVKPLKPKLTKKEPTESRAGRLFKFDVDGAIEIIEQHLEDYLSGAWGVYQLVQTGNETFRFTGVSYPSLSKVALQCGVSEDSMLKYVKAVDEDGNLKNPRLNGSYFKLKDAIKSHLLECGAVGSISSNYLAFVGGVNHGMVNTTKIDNTINANVNTVVATYEKLDDLYNEDLERIRQQRLEMEERKNLFIDDED